MSRTTTWLYWSAGSLINLAIGGIRLETALASVFFGGGALAAHWLFNEVWK